MDFSTDKEGSWILCGQCHKDRDVKYIKAAIRLLTDLLKVAEGDIKQEIAATLIERNKELAEHEGNNGHSF